MKVIKENMSLVLWAVPVVATLIFGAFTTFETKTHASEFKKGHGLSLSKVDDRSIDNQTQLSGISVKLDLILDILNEHRTIPHRYNYLQQPITRPNP